VAKASMSSACSLPRTFALLALGIFGVAEPASGFLAPSGSLRVRHQSMLSIIRYTSPPVIMIRCSTSVR
jgi:hypothetical protein